MHGLMFTTNLFQVAQHIPMVPGLCHDTQKIYYLANHKKADLFHILSCPTEAMHENNPTAMTTNIHSTKFKNPFHTNI